MHTTVGQAVQTDSVKGDVVRMRADMLLDLGLAGFEVRDLQRLSFARLQLLALKVTCPGLFNADGTVRR